MGRKTLNGLGGKNRQEKNNLEPIMASERKQFRFDQRTLAMLNQQENMSEFVRRAIKILSFLEFNEEVKEILEKQDEEEKFIFSAVFRCIQEIKISTKKAEPAKTKDISMPESTIQSEREISESELLNKTWKELSALCKSVKIAHYGNKKQMTDRLLKFQQEGGVLE